MRWVWLAALLALGCGGVRSIEIHRSFQASAHQSPAHKRHADVAALPEIGRLSSGNTELILRGKMTRARRRGVMRIARNTYRDLHKRFLRKRPLDRRPPVDVCVFFSDRRFNHFVGRMFGGVDLPRYGFYLEQERLLVVNLSRSLGNLRHELAHPLINDDFPEVPHWLNEGMASLYGTARHSRRGYNFVVNYRLRHLRAAYRRGDMPTLRGLALSDYDDVHGAHWRTYYAAGRYLLLYLERNGRLAQFYRTMRAGPINAVRQFRVMRHYVDYDQFVRWTGRIRMGRAVRPRR